MKGLAALFGVVSCLGAVFYHPQAGSGVHVIVLGNHKGNLSPCGCSSPMLGGILREASVIRSLQKQGPYVVVDSGNMSAENSEQEVLKAQTLAQTLASLHTTAINLSFSDAKLGSAELGNLGALLNEALLSSSIEPAGGPGGFGPGPIRRANGFSVTGITVNPKGLARRLGGGSSVDAGTAIKRMEDYASHEKLRTLLLLDGEKEQAVEIAKKHPTLDLIVFNSTSKPLATPLQVGKTLLVSPGERGEYLLDLTYSDNGQPGYRAITLGEDIKDDAQAGRFYKTYLQRIEEHHLWENLPRLSGKAFAGAEACSKCHTDDYKIWKSSPHAQTLHTLEAKGHAKDPECLKCHVTGADFKTGFRSLQSTPKLAFVGCESCHGAAADHVRKPYLFHLPKVTQTTCINCHEQLNSPHFDFSTYWPKIRHGKGENRWKDHP